MKSNANRRIALARANTARALGHYRSFSESELLTETSDLHGTLAEVEAGIGFSPAARRGVREAVIRQLLAVDAEHSRRAAGSTVQVTA